MYECVGQRASADPCAAADQGATGGTVPGWGKVVVVEPGAIALAATVVTAPGVAATTSSTPHVVRA
jgi:hypothetical protein